MARFKVTAPDGKAYAIEAPDDATEQEIEMRARSMISQMTPKASPKSQTGIGFIDKSNDAAMAKYQQSRANIQTAKLAPKKGPLEQFGSDLIEPAINAGKAVAQSYRDFSAAGRQGDAKAMQQATNKGLGGMFGAITSPITGTIDATFTRPIARTMQALGIVDEQGGRDMLNQSYLGVMPARGAAGALAPRPAPSPRAPIPPKTPVGKAMATRMGADPVAMRAEADRLRALGIDPTVTDIVGQKGERVIRAVGTTSPEAGQTLTNRAQTVVANTKPAVMDRTRKLVNDPRSAAQAAEDARALRETQAATDYAPAYSEPAQMTPEAVAALRGPDGRAAIDRALRAARARQDYAQMDELQSLLDGDLNALPQVSSGALDRVRIAMGERGAKMRDSGSRDIASGLFQRQTGIDTALENTKGLAPARQAYKDQTQAINVLEDTKGARADFFSTDPADYGSWLESLSPQAREANRLAIRQEIMDTLGGQRRSGYGSLDELSQAPYVRENLRHALGPEEANSYIDNIQARVDQARRATEVTPGAGSRTAVLDQDAQALQKGFDFVKKGADIATSNPISGALKLTEAWLTRAGMNEKTARELAAMAADPARTDEAIRLIEQAMGPSKTLEFIKSLPGRVPREAYPAIAGANSNR